MAKHYYRLNPESNRFEALSKSINTILIFNEEIKNNSTRYFYPVNEPYYCFYSKEVLPISDEELQEILKKENEMPLTEVLASQAPFRHAPSDSTNRLSGGINSFATRNKGELATCSVRAHCYARFSGIGVEEAVFWDNFLLTKEKKESIRDLYHWLMNHSPWLHCIHPSWDILSAQERTDRAINGPIPVNMKAPANEVVGFAVAFRVISEHSYTIPSYLALRRHGASEGVAFILAAFLLFDEKGGAEYLANSGSHHFLIYSQSLKEICKFLKQGFHYGKRKMGAFNKSTYDRIAEQITPHGLMEGTIGGMIESHMKYKGVGWDRECIGSDVSAIIKAFNKEMDNV